MNLEKESNQTAVINWDLVANEYDNLFLYYWYKAKNVQASGETCNNKSLWDFCIKDLMLIKVNPTCFPCSIGFAHYVLGFCARVENFLLYFVFIILSYNNNNNNNNLQGPTVAFKIG